MRLKQVFNNTIFYPYQYPKFRKGSMVRIKHRYKYATNYIDGIFETDKPSGSVTPNTGVKALKPDYLPYHIRIRFLKKYQCTAFVFRFRTILS